MAAIAHVLTLARAAALLGEDEDLLHECGFRRIGTVTSLCRGHLFQKVPDT